VTLRRSELGFPRRAIAFNYLTILPSGPKTIVSGGLIMNYNEITDNIELKLKCFCWKFINSVIHYKIIKLIAVKNNTDDN